MIDKRTDFFKTVNNFARIATVTSIPVFKNDSATLPLVSIVIPTHKRTALLKAAVESAIKHQNCPAFEIIVVDDNPERDCNTERLMKSIADERISYYKNEQNLGQINNWNRCFELAKGKWVAMPHDDDLLLENFLHDCFTVKPVVKQKVKKGAAPVPVIALTISQFLEEGLVFFEEFQTLFSL